MTPLRFGARKRVPCPACAEPVLADARKCRYCGEWFADLDERWNDPGSRLPARLIDLDTGEAVRSSSRQPRERSGVVVIEIAERLDMGRGSWLRELRERIDDVERRIEREFGVTRPHVTVRTVETYGPDYRVCIEGVPMTDGTADRRRLLAIGSNFDELADLELEQVPDPIYATPSAWIPADARDRAEHAGFQVFDASDVLATHLAEVLKTNLADLVTREETAELLNIARQHSPMVVQELVPNMLSLGQLRQVLQGLVREQVPITNMSVILNALADNAVYTKDPHALTEHVRQALGRRLCSRYQGMDGVIRAFMLSPDAERTIQNAIQLNETGQVLMLDPLTSASLQSNLADALGRHRSEILDPIIVAPPKIRRHVKSLLERHFSKIVVLGYSEIVPGVQIENLETIECELPLDGSDVGPPVTGGDWLNRPGSGDDDAMTWSW